MRDFTNLGTSSKAISKWKFQDGIVISFGWPCSGYETRDQHGLLSEKAESRLLAFLDGSCCLLALYNSGSDSHVLFGQFSDLVIRYEKL